METDNPQLLIIKKRELELKRQRLAIARNNGVAFYRPHEKQTKFHAAGLQYNRRMVRAGNRFGKSEMGCAEDVAWLLGERLWLPESDPVRKGGIPQRPIKLLTITTDWDKVDEIWTNRTSTVGTGGKAWRMLPQGFSKRAAKNHAGCVDTIECSNGALWRFDTVKSFIQNPQGSESSDWDAIHVDEPCPEAMFKACARGLVDRNGAAWFTLTPLSEAWINDYFFPQDTRGAARDNVWAISGSIWDNPYLPVEAIKEYLATLSPDERECREKGLPLHLSGMIFKMFDWDRHVLKRLPTGWKSWTEPPEDWTYYVTIDPHPQTPHAVQFAVVDPNQHMYVYNDIFDHCMVSTLCERIRNVLGPRRPVSVRIDPCAFMEDPVTFRTMASEFCRCGVYVEKGSKALMEGILKTQGVLSSDPVMLHFTPTCARTLWEIQRYSWDPNGSDKPLDKDDHMMENLRRFVVQEPRFVANDRYNVPIADLVIDHTDVEDAFVELDSFAETDLMLN